MIQYKGVVFDINGTLLWDTGLHNQAWDIFLQRYGFSLTDQEKNEIIHGRNNQLIFPVIFHQEMSTKELEGYVSEKEAIYRELCVKKGIDFAPGAVDFIGFLKDNNVLCAVATASGKENVDFYCTHLHLDKLIDKRLIIFNDGSYRSKPDPHIFLAAIQEMGLKSRDVIIFEDSQAGIIAASRANPGKVIIVNSTGGNYDSFGFETITSFDQVNRNIFET